jgi:hypothetical protein
MNEKNLRQFIRLLGLEIQSEGEEWLNVCCPLSPWTHASHQMEVSASAGFSFSTKGKRSKFKCFTCGERHLPDFVELLLNLEHRDITPELQALLDVNGEGNVAPLDTDFYYMDPWKDNDSLKEDYEGPYEVTDFVKNQAPLLIHAKDNVAIAIKRYLIDQRGIPSERLNACLNHFNIRYVPQDCSIGWEYTTILGEVAGIKTKECPRNSGEKIKNPKMSFIKDPEPSLNPNSKKVGMMFGYHLINWERAVILVEGEYDAMRLWSLGEPNVLAVGTADFPAKKLGMLLGATLWLGMDADEAGKKSTSRNIVKFREYSPSLSLFTLNWALSNKSNGSPCKDAGDLPDRAALEQVLGSKVAVPYPDEVLERFQTKKRWVQVLT